MTDFERRALLGDRQAQEALTKRGRMVRCPLCGSNKIKRTSGISFWCKDCSVTITFPNSHNALEIYNARHAPPIGRCGECKHSTNPAALTMIYGEPGTLTCHFGPCNRRNVNENDFCSYFEPKGGEENASD